jgi:hypothetical protein
MTRLTGYVGQNGHKRMNTADYAPGIGKDQDIALLTGGLVIHADLRQASSVYWVSSYLEVLLPAIGSASLAKIPLLDSLLSGFVKLVRLRCFSDCIDPRGFCALRILSTVRDVWTRSTSKVFRCGDRNREIINDDILQTPGRRWDSVSSDFDLDQDAALMLALPPVQRAVRVTHRNIQANADSIIEYLALDNCERMLVILPFYYCFGTSLLHTHLRVGASLALCNTFAYPETALDMIVSTRSTGFAGVPSTYQTLLRNTSFPRRGLKSLKKVQQAGGKLPVVFIQELLDALPETQVFIMYGQTEATARLSYLPPSQLDKKMGSIGGIPGVDLRRRRTGDPVNAGEVGDHCYRRQHQPRLLQRSQQPRPKNL